MKTPREIVQTTKHIIALSGSPSKGRNSDSMLDAFIEGIKKYSKDIKITKKYVVDIPIETYRFENGQGPMEYEEDFRILTEDIKNADGLVIATPTYNFGVPSELKNFIDRIRCIALDLKQKNKLGQPTGKMTHLSTYFLVTGGTPRWAQKILFFAFPPFWLRSVFLYYGAKCFGAYYSGDVRTFENKKILNNCKKFGYRYAKKVMKCHGNRILERIFWRPPQVD